MTKFKLFETNDIIFYLQSHNYDNEILVRIVRKSKFNVDDELFENFLFINEIKDIDTKIPLIKREYYDHKNEYDEAMKLSEKYIGLL